MGEHCNSGTSNISHEGVSNDEHKCSALETSAEASDSLAEGAQTPPFVCAGCEKCFAELKLLTEHQCAHLHRKIFSCDTCGKTFCSRISLYSHVHVHLNKQFMCEICDKKFTSRYYLTTHMRIHTGTKPYSCDHCEKSFNQRGTLVRHMTVHSDKKPFRCRTCFQYFSDRPTYVLHLQAHLIMK